MFKFFKYGIEILNWLRIVASPTIIGGVIGAIIYLAYPNPVMLVIGIVVAANGLVVGIIWATKVWKKTGTTNFLSRVIASPELDSKEEKENK